jgi:undecaprenyl-diphosphatase
VNAALAYVSHRDLRVFEELQVWRAPRWFRLWMLWSTRLADGWVYLLLGALLLASGGPGRRLLSAGSLGACVANALLLAIKRRVRRPRPCDMAPHLRYAVRPPDRWSFPSGHTLNAFTVGTLVALGFPACAPLALLLAGSVGASRVVLGMHFLSDVLAGALLGALIGSAAYGVMC